VNYEQNIDGCLAGVIGEYGLTDAELAPFLDDASMAISDLRADTSAGTADILALPARRDDIAAFAPLAEEMRARFETVIVLGVGGSSLGGRSVTQLKLDEGNATDRRKLEIRFIDNLDPAVMAMTLKSIDFSRTGWLVISKSGRTAEILAQYLVCHDAVRTVLGRDAANQFVVVTDPTDNPLRRLAVEGGHRIIDHDPGVGGRFSVLSVVGLLPAAIAGLDPAAIRTGAAGVLEQAFGFSSPDPCPAAQGAALSLGLASRRGAAMHVLMPYGNSLEPFAAWYVQLWAESLGKNGKGTTPVRALGPMDQHSQLQLYLDGPRDKMFTIITTAVQDTGPKIPDLSLPDDEIEYLAGARIGDLVAAQQQATTEALIRRGRPTRVISLGQIDEAAMGALYMHFILETIVAARMLGVDPFDQPAVDEGKTLMKSYLDRR
jgi:glucose-6-phosphate isomerase